MPILPFIPFSRRDLCERIEEKLLGEKSAKQQAMEKIRSSLLRDLCVLLFKFGSGSAGLGEC